MVKSRQRSRRKDPEQEAIVQVKDEINERMSKLIELLKDVKSGMNGGPAPEVGVPEKINLTQPLPDSVPTAGSAAVQELSAISQGISQVNQMQDAYAAKREQRLADRSNQMKELQNQVAEAAVEEEFRKVASNALTRTWAHIIAPFGSEQGRWERLSLLRSLARLDDNLTKVEDQVLSGDPAILDALHIAKQLYIDSKTSFFDTFRKQLNSMVSSTVDEVKKLKDEVKEAQDNGLFDFTQEPLRDGSKTPGISKAPSSKPSVLEKATQAVSAAENAVQDVQTRADQVEQKNQELASTPVQFPDSIPDSSIKLDKTKSQPQVDKPDVVELSKPVSEPSVSEPSVSEPGELLEEPSELHEDVLNPPPDVPAVDPSGISKAVRLFIWKNSHDMYATAHGELSQLSNIPEPWKSRLANIWQSITVSLQAIRTKPPIDKMITAYMHFIKGIGDLGANIYVLNTELKASELKPDFVFGSNINDQQLESQAVQFARSHWNELQSMIPQEGLVSEGGDITRWLKRIKTHLSLGSDKNLRLIVAKDIRNSRERLQVMLNNLENKNINFRALIAQSDAFYDSFIDMYDKLSDLAESYNSRMMIEKSKRKYDKGRMRYDIIRETDIRSIRNIRDLLKQDKQSIAQLESLENQFSEIQRELEKAKEQHG